MPPESSNDFRNYEEFLGWRDQEIMWAMGGDLDIKSCEEAEGIIDRLTGAYPAAIIKICAQIYSDLEKPYEILEQANPAAAGANKNGGKFTIASLRRELGIENTTLNMYAQGAEVKTPGRGKKNHKYSREEVIKICQRIIAKSSTEDIVTNAERLLARLK